MNGTGRTIEERLQATRMSVAGAPTFHVKPQRGSHVLVAWGAVVSVGEAVLILREAVLSRSSAVRSSRPSGGAPEVVLIWCRGGAVCTTCSLRRKGAAAIGRCLPDRVFSEPRFT